MRFFDLFKWKTDESRLSIKPPRKVNSTIGEMKIGLKFVECDETTVPMCFAKKCIHVRKDYTCGFKRIWVSDDGRCKQFEAKES
jgi:hypothetical protein